MGKTMDLIKDTCHAIDIEGLPIKCYGISMYILNHFKIYNDGMNGINRTILKNIFKTNYELVNRLISILVDYRILDSENELNEKLSIGSRYLK